MLMPPAANRSSISAHQLPDLPLNEDELSRLRCLQMTAAAERHLVGQAQPCPDHEVCRRLAFARWLHTTGRLPAGRARPGVAPAAEDAGRRSLGVQPGP